MSLDEADNSMWGLILAVNTLRNNIAHSLDSQERQKAYQRFKQVCDSEMKESACQKFDEPHLLASLAMAHCLDFLQGFEAENDRFKECLNTMDKIVNPHRHMANVNE